MEVRLCKLSPTHHVFEYLRNDGTGERAELETKTYLTHDFLHFAFETEARLSDGFYGLLASGRTFAGLRDTMDDPAPAASLESMHIEMFVGALTGIIKGASAADVLSGIRNLMEARKEEVPSWFTEELIERVKERMRRLTGEWNALSRSAVMTLVFPDTKIGQK